ncbi:MAG: serine hydrolase domain-containing protein [Gemmatimonadaceae bacterium]
MPRDARIRPALLVAVVALVAPAALVAAGVPSPALAQTPSGFDAAWSDIASFHERSVKEEGIAGSSLMFVHDGEVIGRSIVGLADIESNRAVDDSTIYHWASITKTFTAIAIMQLRDRGLLELDDPVVQYVPELVAVRDTFGEIGDITIRHLMSHASGFRNPTWPWGGDEPWHPHEPTEWSQIVAMLPYTEILFQPGTRYSYSNPGIIFLGQVIERLSGDDYEVYVDKNILTPLGMYSSYYDVTPYHLLRHRSNNYHVVDGELTANGLDFDTGITTSNGGLNAPLVDMVKYLNFLTGTGAHRDAHDGVLKRSSLAEMWDPHQQIARSDSVSTAIGLSYFITDVRGTRYIGHTGGQKAFVSFFAIQPESRSAAIGAFNTTAGDSSPDGPKTGAVMRAVTRRLYEEIFPLFPTRRAGAGERTSR